MEAKETLLKMAKSLCPQEYHDSLVQKLNGEVRCHINESVIVFLPQFLKWEARTNGFETMPKSFEKCLQDIWDYENEVDN